jgi:hypothetical protein
VDEKSTSIIDQKIVKIIKEKKPTSVKELVDLVNEKASISKKLIYKHVLNLQNQGKIQLKSPQTVKEKNFSTFLKTKDTNWFKVIIILTILTILSISIIPENSYPLYIFRYILGTVFIIWLPGYTFTKVLFFNRSRNEATKKGLDRIELIVISIGASLILVSLVGLLLNYTPWGIQLVPIMLLLSFLTIGFAVIAIYSEYHYQFRE